jgi:thermolabile hemolysin
VRRWGLFVFFGVLCLFWGGNASAATYRNLVVFGDSLSDAGNLFGKLGTTSTLYPEGRFSNGPVWAEYLANHLDANLIDFAYAGARTGDSTLIPGLKTQVSDLKSILQLYPALLGPRTLFVIWAGSNDLLAGTDYQEPVKNIADALDTLASLKAQNILVLNLPNLGLTPELNKSPSDAAAAEAKSTAFNTALADTLDVFQSENADIKLFRFDAYSLLEDIVNNPQAFGFDDVKESENPGGTLSGSTDGVYLFWDAIHPTTAAHKVLAVKVAEAIEGVGDTYYEAGFLYAPSTSVGPYTYNVLLELFDVPDDPSGIYFKVKSISGN